MLSGAGLRRGPGARQACRAPSLPPVRPATRLVCQALYHNPGPRPERAKGAQRALESVLALVKAGNREGLVEYFDNKNLQDVPTLKLAGGTDDESSEMVVFEDVLEHMLLQSPNKHFLDSYAIRHLTFTPPASAQVLSGLMLGPNKYVQRMEVTSHAGETAILTFTMTSTTPPPLPPAAPASLPEPGTAAAAIAAASVPADQAAAAPAPPPPEPEPVWRLRSVRGEPAYSSMLPEGPSPELSPEQVVEAQLHALQNRDPVTAFRFFSAGSQKILGSEDKFGESLKKNRRYGAMLGHMAATSVRRCMVRATTYMEVVAVTSASGTRFVFLYILSQEPTGPHGGGGWHIETVKVVDDKKLLEAVESSCAQQRAAAQDDD